MMNLVRELWNDNPLRLLCVGLVALLIGVTGATAGIAWINSGPAVTIRRDGAESVKVSGIDVLVEANGLRTRSACQSAYAIRRMLRYWPDGSIRDVAFIQEKELGNLEKGERKYTLHLHLYSPLENGGWYYVAEIHDQCGMFTDVLQRRPSVTMPAPVTFVASAPQTSGANVNFLTPSKP